MSRASAFSHCAFRAGATALCLSALAAPAFADLSCPIESAVYTDAETGFQLSFRPLQPWESTGMTLAIFDVVLKDGRELWGVIRTNMGTSRDVGQIYDGCPPPGPEDHPEDEQLAACQVWEGLVYAVAEDQIGAFPVEAEAPQSLLFTDLGRKLRYAIFSSPGEEPWDQLRLTACQPE